MKLSWRGGRLKGNPSVFMAAAANAAYARFVRQHRHGGPLHAARHTSLILAFTAVAGCRTHEGRPPLAGSHNGSASRPPSSTMAGPPCALTLSPIRAGRAGVLQVGMSVDSLLRLCSSASRFEGQDEEGGAAVSYDVPVAPNDTVVADVDTLGHQAVVSALSIGFRGPRTDKGVG